MPRIASSTVLRPILEHRFMIHTSRLPGVQLYGKSVQLPTFDNAPVRLDHKGGYINVKGRTIWNDISITCYQFEGITMNSLWAYVNSHQDVKSGDDKEIYQYKNDMQLWVLNPAQAPLGKWTLVDAFISSLSWGDMAWDGDAVTECTLNIVYDYAKYEGI